MQRAPVLLLAAGLLVAQTTPGLFVIRLPPGIPSQTFFARYAFPGDTLGGWIQSQPNVDTYTIETTRNGHTAASLKAIFYSPGCEIRTISVPLPAATWTFDCAPVPNLTLTGHIEPADYPFHGPITLEARYVAYWATQFLGTTPGVTVFAIAELSTLDPGNHFKFLIPDLSATPGAELQLWARDRATGALVAQLVPQPALRTRMGGLPLEHNYPPELIFNPCLVNGPYPRNAEGFAIRPPVTEGCDR